VVEIGTCKLLSESDGVNGTNGVGVGTNEVIW
jgi:hypothetical protein